MFGICAPPAQVDSHGEVPIAAVRVEAIVPQSELHQWDVRGVHALQGDAGRADVPAGFCDQILQSLQHLLQDGALDQASLEHGCCGVLCLRRWKDEKGFSESSGFVLLASTDAARDYHFHGTEEFKLEARANSQF